MKKCYRCNKEKTSSDMNFVNFRRLGIQAIHGAKLGYTRYYCNDCLKEYNMYEEVKNGN